MPGFSTGNQYPNQFVDAAGNPTKKKIYTDQTTTPDRSPFYYADVPAPGAVGGVGGASRSGTSTPQGPAPPPIQRPAPAPQVQAPGQVPQAQTPAGVAPVDVNSIMQQWRSIQNPMLPREAEIPHIDSTAAAQASYNRAKDTAGQQGRGAMDALMDVQGARGIVGSGLGVNEAGGVIGAVNQNLSDVNRERMIQDYETELARQTSNAGLRVDQRGQDVDTQGQNNALLNSLISLVQGNQESGLAQRGQNIDVLQGNQTAGLSQRGQNIDVEQGNQSAGVSQRGQNIDLLTTLMRLYPGQQLPFQLG